MCGEDTLIRPLIDCGVDPLSRNLRGMCAVHLSIVQGEQRCTHELLKCLSHVSSAEYLLTAIEGNNPKALRILLQHHEARINAYNLLQHDERCDEAYYLEEQLNAFIGDHGPLMRAIELGHYREVQELLYYCKRLLRMQRKTIYFKMSLDLHCSDVDQTTNSRCLSLPVRILYISIARGWDRITILLLEHVEFTMTDLNGTNPLHMACAHGRLGVLRQLLSQGADPNTPDKDGITPLHYAIRFKHIDVVYELLKHDVNVNAKCRWENFDSWTPLEMALYAGNNDVVEMLYQVGAQSPTQTRTLPLQGNNTYEMLRDFSLPHVPDIL